MFDIHTAPSMGYGVFAARPIKKGTRIIEETPMLLMPIQDKDTDLLIAFNFCNALYGLSDEQLARIDDLVHSPASQDASVAKLEAFRAWHMSHRGKNHKSEVDAQLALRRYAAFQTNSLGRDGTSRAVCHRLVLVLQQTQPLLCPKCSQVLQPHPLEVDCAHRQRYSCWRSTLRQLHRLCLQGL